MSQILRDDDFGTVCYKLLKKKEGCVFPKQKEPHIILFFSLYTMAYKILVLKNITLRIRNSDNYVDITNLYKLAPDPESKTVDMWKKSEIYKMECISSTILQDDASIKQEVEMIDNDAVTLQYTIWAHHAIATSYLLWLNIPEYGKILRWIQGHFILLNMHRVR